MDIKGLGPKTVDKLYQHGLVSGLADLYRLTEEQLLTVPGFQEQGARKLVQSIRQSREVPLNRFISALGVPLVGTTTRSRLVADACGSVDALLACDTTMLSGVDGIGDKVAEAVVKFVRDPVHREEVLELIVLGVTPTHAVTAVSNTKRPWEGKSFVLTGTLAGYSRIEAANLIQERGGKVVMAVSGKTDYLVAGETPGTKLDKAEKLGVTVVTDFATFLARDSAS
jgi:DNA ligase (NAD+)